MSAESGLSTLEMEMAYGINIPLKEVATPEAWRKDKEKVLHFYSMRMENCLKANPNLAHQIIFEFEEKYNVQIVTQNIDNLMKEQVVQMYYTCTEKS